VEEEGGKNMEKRQGNGVKKDGYTKLGPLKWVSKPFMCFDQV